MMDKDRITIMSINEILLKNWQIVQGDNIRYLEGVVYNHPNFRNGERISTSEIITLDGGIAVTSSGRKYRLSSEERIIPF